MKKENIVLGIFLAFIVGAGVYYSSVVQEVRPTARQVFDKLVKAHQQQNIEAYKKLLTKKDAEETTAIQQSSTEGSVRIAKNIEFISEKQEGDTIIIHGKLTSQSDQKREFDYVFVKENGAWKYDASASLKRLNSTTVR